MPEFEQHGWQGFWLPGRRCSGQHGIVVIVKRRFEVDQMDALCKPVPTPPVSLMAEFYDDGEVPMVSVRHASEIAYEKVNVDVMLRGTAFAPGGKPVPQFEVEVRIQNVVKRRLRIFGNRHLVWYPPLKWLSSEDLAKGETWTWPDPDFSEPEPIDKLPLRYEHAYGGWAKIFMTPDAEAAAEEAQATSAVIEDRRKRKKEIVAELKKKEEDAGKPPPPKKMLEVEGKVFLHDEGVDLKLDDATRARLDAEAAKDDGMKIVSAFRLGRDLPETADEFDRLKAEAAAKKEAAEAAADEAKGGAKKDAKKDAKKEADPNAAFFTDSATSMIDLNALKEDDQFKDLLDERAVGQARKLKDEEGTLRDRATEFGDIKLQDDNWAAAYIRNRPEKKKRKLELDEQPSVPFPANMCGKGFCVTHLEEAVENLPLPNIEDPDELLNSEEIVVDLTHFDLNKLRTPAGWAPYPMSWYPRARYFGAYPWDLDAAKKGIEGVKEEYDEEDPDDKVILEQLAKLEIPLMHPLAFQEAHPKLQVKELRGDEEVYLTNLTPEGTLFFRLPGVHPTATIDMSRGPEPLKFKLDTLLIDVEDVKKPAVEMVWRAWYRLKNFAELETKQFRKINVIEVDQDGWLEMQRKEAAKAKAVKDENVALIDDIEVEDDGIQGEEAYLKYLESFRRPKGGVGKRMDDGKDAAVWDQEQDRQLTTDAWDDKFRAERDAFVDEQKERADKLAKLKAKALKAEAREQADEEFGIIRDPETGEVLAVDPPEKGGK